MPKPDNERDTSKPSDISIDELQKSLANHIIEVEKLLTEATPDSSVILTEKVKALDSELTELKSASPAPPRLCDLEVAVYTAKGHVERSIGNLEESEKAYQKGIKLLTSSEDQNPTDSQRAANLWTCCGISALSGVTDESRERALGYFDEAISIRANITEPTLSDLWGLSASWLNRGDALSRLGGEENLKLSLEAAEKAADLMSVFDLTENPAFRTRLALARMNQGAALVELSSHYGQRCGDDAFQAYQNAIDTLRPGAESEIEESKRVLAVALTNLSRARLELGGMEPHDGINEAREALVLITDHEASDPELTNLGLTARIALCRSMELLHESTLEELETTDIAEEGLSIAQRARRGATKALINEAALGELFRCGAEAYWKHSPQFLADYLIEFLSDENDDHFADVAACHEAAVQVLWQGIAELQDKGFQGIGTEAYDKREALLISWQQCREQLAGIRKRYFEI